MDYLSRRNDALDINPQAGDSHLSRGGSSWLFAVTALFGISFLAYFILSFCPRNGERIFHYLFTIALLVGAVAYFAMASGRAYSVVAQHLHISDAATYQIFFAKYILWVVAFPIIIIALGLVSGVSWATMIFNVFLAWVWVVSYLCSAYTPTRYKWGFYAFGTLAYLLLAFQTLWASRTHAKRLDVGRDHTILSGYVNILWLLYPIAFGISDGGNVISVTRGMIFFSILDILLILGTAIAFLILARKWDYGRMNLYFTQNGRVNEMHTEKTQVPSRNVDHSNIDSNTATASV
jgi:bacteriorhodopsin